MARHMLRHGRKYNIDEVLDRVIPTDKVGKKAIRVDFDGDLIKTNSDRLFVFKTKGIKCCECGIEGKYFVKEKTINDEYYHFNLYAVNEEREEVLMTKDHIKPRSKGGHDHTDNYQTMCAICNVAKGNEEKENEI